MGHANEPRRVIAIDGPDRVAGSYGDVSRVRVDKFERRVKHGMESAFKVCFAINESETNENDPALLDRHATANGERRPRTF